MKFNENVVKNSNQINKSGKKIITFCVLLFLALILILPAFTIVPAGSTGVVVTLGKVSEDVLQEGFHLKIPYIQKVEIMSNKIQVVEAQADAVSKDLQSISSKIAVNYRISLDASASIYKNIGSDYQTILMMPSIQESMKSITAKYTAEQLITERAQVGQEIKDTLTNKLQDYGIYIEKFNIVNFDFSVEFNNAIEAKQVAEQNLIKTRTEQEQAIVVEEANAKKKIIAAEAEAEAILKTAEAQAEANNKINASLSDTVLKNKTIEKWNGQLPKVTGETGTLIDVNLDE